MHQKTLGVLQFLAGPSIDEGIIELWYIYTIGYYYAVNNMRMFGFKAHSMRWKPYITVPKWPGT